MFTLRRWRDKTVTRLIVGGMAVSGAMFLWYTEGTVIFEVYQAIVNNLPSDPQREEKLGIAKIQEIQNQLQEVQTENQKLKQLLKYTTPIQPKGVLAPIVGRGADNWWQQVTIGKGTQDGIKTGSIVMGIGGLVGRVTSTTTHTSRVLLISDPNSRVGVLVSRSRHMGFIQGIRGNQATLQFFDKVPDVKKGDVITTSAVSQLFPPGLPVGRVIDINMQKAPAPEAVIELTAPMNYLEWVTVHPHQASPEIKDTLNKPPKL